MPINSSLYLNLFRFQLLLLFQSLLLFLPSIISKMNINTLEKINQIILFLYSIPFINKKIIFNIFNIYIFTLIIPYPIYKHLQYIISRYKILLPQLLLIKLLNHYRIKLQNSHIIIRRSLNALILQIQ